MILVNLTCMHVRGLLCIILFSCLFSLFSSTTSRKVKYANCWSRTHACIPHDQAGALIEKLKPVAFFFRRDNGKVSGICLLYFLFSRRFNGSSRTRWNIFFLSILEFPLDIPFMVRNWTQSHTLMMIPNCFRMTFEDIVKC